MLSTGFNKSSYNTYTINTTTTRSKLTATGIKIKYDRKDQNLVLRMRFLPVRVGILREAKRNGAEKGFV